ncbi:MAG TPA: IPT/TIG domain-containing protein [Candidatus Paceibacterota bacterium]|nr:IPT/TIG domain-containing protein [Candidatus Paceibacterota bacterium]
MTAVEAAAANISSGGTSATTITNGTELEVSPGTAVINQTVYPGDLGDNLMTLNVQASTSPINLQRIQLDLGNSSSFYTKFFQTLYLVDEDGNVLAQANLNGNTVTTQTNSNGTNTYLLTFSGFNKTIPADGVTHTLTIKGDVYPSIDPSLSGTSVSISIDPNALRGVDNSGVDQYAPLTGSILSSVQVETSLVSTNPTNSPLFTLVGTPTIVTGQTPFVNNYSTTTVTAQFNVNIQAVGGNFIFGTQASASTFNLGIYENGVEVTPVGAAMASFLVPTSGVITTGLTANQAFELQQNNSVQIPVTFLFNSGSVSGTGNYAVGLDSINYENSSGAVQTANYMYGSTAWRTSSVSLTGTGQQGGSGNPQTPVAFPGTFSDSFSNGPSPLWSNSRGNYTVQNGRYMALTPNAYNPINYSGLPYLLTNFSVDVDVNNTGDGGIWLRSDATGQNGVLLVLGGYGWYNGERSNLSGHELYWHVVQNGIPGPVLDEVDNVFQNPGSENDHVHVVVSGNTYSVYLNGSTQPVSTLVDNTYTQGYVGLYAIAGTSFSNFVLSGSTSAVSLPSADNGQTTTSTGAGCAVGAMFSSTTGASCATSIPITSTQTTQTTPTISPNNQTVASGQTATVHFTAPADTVRGSLFLSCPSGIVAKGVGSNDCNTWIPYGLGTGEITYYSVVLTNTTSQPQNVVPNYYVYLSSNPNYAVGVSSTIVVNPASQTTTPTMTQSTNPLTSGQTNTIPTINFVSPSSAFPDGQTVVTVNGSGFTNASTIYLSSSVGSQAVSTNFISNSALTFVVPASLYFGTTYNLSVANGNPANGISVAVAFTTLAATGTKGSSVTPTITSVSPTSGISGSGIITVHGSNFISNSVINLAQNGTPSAQMYGYGSNIQSITPNQIVFTLPNSTPGLYQLYISNNGQQSDIIPVTITAPLAGQGGGLTVYPNIAGTWYIGTRSTSIAENGSSLTFTNENGSVSAGNFTSTNSVLATTWGTAGTLSSNLQTISWANGTAWTRMPPTATITTTSVSTVAAPIISSPSQTTITVTPPPKPPAQATVSQVTPPTPPSAPNVPAPVIIGSYPSIAGTWYIGTKPTSIAENGSSLTFTNENGSVSAGNFTGTGSILATTWGTAGTLSSDLQTISWANNTKWTRAATQNSISVFEAVSNFFGSIFH